MASSQYLEYHGEVHNNIPVDKVLRNYFPDFNYRGTFFDVGAFDPIVISNSYHFEKNGWDVYCFEANTDLIPKLKQFRKNVFHYAISDTDRDSVEFNIVYTMKDWSASFSSIDINPRYKNIFGWDKQWETKKIQVPQKTLNTVIQTEIVHHDKIDILSIDVEGGEMNVLKGLDISKYSPKIIVVENVGDDRDLDNYIRKFGYSLSLKSDYNHFYESH
jgi:FkbM family methyltransferase